MNNAQSDVRRIKNSDPRLKIMLHNNRSDERVAEPGTMHVMFNESWQEQAVDLLVSWVDDASKGILHQKHTTALVEMTDADETKPAGTLMIFTYGSVVGIDYDLDMPDTGMQWSIEIVNDRSAESIDPGDDVILTESATSLPSIPTVPQSLCITDEDQYRHRLDSQQNGTYRGLNPSAFPVLLKLKSDS